MLGKALVMQHPEPLHVLQHLKNSPRAVPQWALVRDSVQVLVADVVKTDQPNFIKLRSRPLVANVAGAACASR